MKVAAIGDNCIDLYTKENKAYPGGNPVNVAVYLKRMGIDASYIGAVGTDKYGRFLIDSLKSKQVDIGHVHILEGNTAISYVEIINGNRVFSDYNEGVMSQFRLNGDDFQFLKKHNLVVSGIWGHTTSSLERIKKDGLSIVFDYSDQTSDPAVDSSIRYVDYAFFGLDEEDNESLRRFMRTKQSMGPKIVVVTLGDQGSVAYDGEVFYKYGILDTKVVDTMGAGDSFIAGFIRGILEHKNTDECMRLGAESSAITLQYSGAW